MAAVRAEMMGPRIALTERSHVNTYCRTWTTGMILIVLLLTITSPPFGAAEPAPPFSVSYLAVWTDFTEYETFDRIQISLQSHLVSGSGNNTTASASGNLINVTLYAEDLDLIVYSENVRLSQGNGSVISNVAPEWTTSRIQVIAVDRIAGLENRSARFRTVMSWSYFLYLDRVDEYEDDLRDKGILQARLDLITYLGSAITVSMVGTLFVIFMRMDHRRSRRVNAPSIWDRFVNRVWPYSWTNDEAYAMLEDPETWAPDTAAEYRDFKKTAHLRKLRAQLGEIKEEARAIQEGRIHV